MQKADCHTISWGPCLKSKCPGSIPGTSDFRLGKAQESVCLQKLCPWFWCQVWKLGHPRSSICLVGVLGHEPVSLILRAEHLLPCLRKCTFHSWPLITLTELWRVLLMLNPTCWMEWNGKDHPLLQTNETKKSVQTLPMDHYGYNITILS